MPWYRKKSSNAASQQALRQQPQSPPDRQAGWTCATCTFWNADDVAAAFAAEAGIAFDAADDEAVLDMCRACQQPRQPHRDAAVAAAVAAIDEDGALLDQFPDGHGVRASKRVVVCPDDDFARNRHVTGTFEVQTFQVSLRRHAPRDEPLGVGVFPGLGYHCLPQLGRYGHEYDPTPPIALIELPDDFIDQQRLPASVLAAIAPDRARGIEIEFYVALHARRGLVDDAEGEATRVNVMAHMWAFSHAHFDPSVRVEDLIEIGVFDPFGAASANPRGGHINNININDDAKVDADADADGAGDAVPFHRLGRRVQCVHDLRFSPDNCHLHLVRPQAHRNVDNGRACAAHGFFLVVRYRYCIFAIQLLACMRPSLESSTITTLSKDSYASIWLQSIIFFSGRCIVSHHTIAGDAASDGAFAAAAFGAASLGELLEALRADARLATVHERWMDLLEPFFQRRAIVAE
jgi:hypothetical protein